MVGAAHAQRVCGDHSMMIAYLDRDYQYSRSGLGLASNGAVVELYTAKSGTWTMLITPPGEKTCVIGSGKSGENQLVPERKVDQIEGDDSQEASFSAATRGKHRIL